MRKHILSVFLLIIFFSSNALSQSGKPLFPNTPGLQTYTFRESFKKSVPASLDTIKSMGITVLESSTNPEGLTPEEFKKLLDERGLKSPSVGVGYDELIKNPAEVARKAKIIGAKYVMTAWIPHGKEFTLADAQKTVKDFNAAGKVLKEKGIIFCYHTHGFEFVPYQNGTLFDYIVQNTNPDFVSFEMDIMWVFHGGQDPAKLLLKYPTRWKLMHLKDKKKGVPGDLTGGTSVENDVALGTGQLNIPETLSAAKKVGVEYYFIEDESSRFREQVLQTMAYLKGLKEVKEYNPRISNADLDKSPLDIAYFPENYAHDRKPGEKPIIRVIYSRPVKNGREIFGKLVPYKQVWRTGANEATEIKFYRSVNFGGKNVAAGTYSLFTVPGEKEWEIILNKDLDYWGAYSYNKSKDVVRVKVASRKISRDIENFTLNFTESGSRQCEMYFGWDNTFVSVPIRY